MSEITIRQRHEIPQEDTWALEHLYATEEAWEQDLAVMENEGEALAAYAGKLGSDADTLLAYLTGMEQMNARGELLGNYCMRKADQDTRNTKDQAMSGKFMSVVVALGAKCSFETPEILAIPEETLESFYAAQPKLERYRRYLTDARRMKAHVLSPAEEKLVAAAGAVTGAPSDIFGNLTNAGMTVPQVGGG